MTRPLPDIDSVETWLFDLDNTLYPASCRLFDQIDVRMGEFIQRSFDLDPTAARVLQKDYFRRYGTTLKGLMDEHGVDPHAYLDYVHDIDHSPVEPDKRLSESLARLPGRKVIFTNASTNHAEKVLERLEIAHHFEAIFDIHQASYIPKPAEQPYDQIIAAHGIEAPRTVFFEDSAKNLAPAAARGMTTVWVEHAADWSRGNDAELDYVHHRTDDLGAWLSALTTDRP